MRKGSPKKRPVEKDPKFNNEMVAKLVNNLMLDGKKNLAYNIVYTAFNQVEEKNQEEPLEVFNRALANVMPTVQVRSKRVGGATFQIPAEVREERRYTLALKWIIRFSRLRNEKDMANKLASEIIDAANNEGGSVRKKVETHKMAEANKAFSHFRF